MIIELPENVKEFYSPEVISYVDFNMDFFAGFSTTFFAYTCQASVLPIYSELINPNKERMLKVIGRSLVIDFIFYAAIALVGYFSTYDNTQEIVIARPL